MSEQIRCTCGAVLVEEVTATGVRPVGADEPIVFRRTTDYVVCATCLQSYDVRSLIEQAQSRETIRHLQLMQDRFDDEPAG